MARYRTDMNSIYISPRAQEALDPIAQCPLTTVVAPMGYGKTTAVQWFLDRRREAGDQVVRVSIYSNDLPLFWRSFQAAWRGTPLAGQLDPMAFPVGDTALGLLSERLLDLLDGAGDYYLFLDDYHLMKDDQVTALLLALARLPGAPLHLIVASRDQVLSPSQALRLGRDLHQITAGDLALNQEEVSAYSRRCGVALPPADLAHLAQTSEGWFSAVYLNLKAYQAHGTLLTSGHDIYEMLNEAMLDPLPQERVDFLARMSLADEFTAEQAAFVTGLAESRELMRALTESNAFLRRLPDGQNYRLHHMMKECLGRRFREESPEEQRLVRCRHGAWYERQGEYLRAFHFYLQAGDDAFCPAPDRRGHRPANGGPGPAKAAVLAGPMPGRGAADRPQKSAGPDAPPVLPGGHPSDADAERPAPPCLGAERLARTGATKSPGRVRPDPQLPGLQ